jgi:mono/diheme cytochrome c family protein
MIPLAENFYRFERRSSEESACSHDYRRGRPPGVIPLSIARDPNHIPPSTRCYNPLLLPLFKEVPVYRFALVLPAVLLVSSVTLAQQQPTGASGQKSSAYSAIPVEAAKQQNPAKPTAESLARAKKWWAMDCEMCHGKTGDGKGETAKDMKLQMLDFTNPDTLRDRTDGEIFYIIKNGHNDMPAEGPRVKSEEAWDLVNYVRSFAKRNADTKPAQ